MMSTIVEVNGELEEIKVDMNLMVRVFNDGDNVYEGTVKGFLEVNEYDGQTIDFVNGLEGKDSHEEYIFHSGDWKVERI